VGIKVHIHQAYRQFTNGLDFVEVEGNNVRDCLDQVVKQFPAMKEALFDRMGKLLNVVEIYVNMKSAYPDELGAKVRAGDKIHITLLLAGG
jgi:molybdopterin converting factor small subunit